MKTISFKRTPFESLKGEVITKVVKNIYDVYADKNDTLKDRLIFYTKSGKKYLMYHEQDCCEQVNIDDITDNYEEILTGEEVLHAEESSKTSKDEDNCGTQTYTFYKLRTQKGYVDIRWHGGSNGYYSESVDFGLVEDLKRN